MKTASDFKVGQRVKDTEYEEIGKVVAVGEYTVAVEFPSHVFTYHESVDLKYLEPVK